MTSTITQTQYEELQRALDTLIHYTNQQRDVTISKKKQFDALVDHKQNEYNLQLQQIKDNDKNLLEQYSMTRRQKIDTLNEEYQKLSSQLDKAKIEATGHQTFIIDQKKLVLNNNNETAKNIILCSQLENECRQLEQEIKELEKQKGEYL
ncbi:Hypothetical_protein [Hexamita inflata]|uniref:Hypothetical_protein n=1 Tax=Hexamita inflata TaxID=28002 RepID=A0ABP1K3Q4_9EUKA